MADAADSTIPFYLRATYDPPKPNEVGFDTNYDYSYESSKGQSPTTLWQDIASSADSGITTVFDKASGTWQAIKDTGSEIIHAPVALAGSLLDTLKENILWVLVVGLVVIIVVAKTGILKQAQGFL